MITKKEIRELVNSNAFESIYKTLESCPDDKELLFFLSNLGPLPPQFDGQVFVPYLKHKNAQVRLWSVKNLGKVSNGNYFITLTDVFYSDSDSEVKRESISAIGRMRTEQAIPVLVTVLNDPDPKIVLQAIRALLVFKRDKFVANELKKLNNHPNEIIQSVIRKEFFSNYTNNKNSNYPHAKVRPFLKNVVVYGDVRDVLRFVPDDSIHLTFTSPPYFNARDYSIYPSYQAYLEFLNEVFQEVHRVTKEGRFFMVNTSPVIMPRVSRQHSSKRYAIPFDLHSYLIKMGWEFIDDIIWIKPETSVKNRNAGFLQHRKPLGYKTNAVTEYVMVYRKQTDRLIDWNMRQYPKNIVEASKVKGDYETSNAWHIDPVFDKVHSAVFPVELCNRVIQFYSYKGDVVFDPFGGSGTTGKAAINLERFFFLTEQDAIYVDRMRENLNRSPLFIKKVPEFLTIDEFRDRAKASK